MLENDIKILIKILEESKIDELEVSTFWGRQKICLRRRLPLNPANIDIKETLNQSIDEKKTVPIDVSNAEHNEDVSSAPIQTINEEKSSIAVEALTIKSPLVGTFYKSPKPDMPPFISEGDKIMEGQIIGIIEAMKIFNEIESEFTGTILKILVEDGTPVEYDQELLIISPD